MGRFAYAEGDNIRLAVFAIVFTVLALSLGDALIKQVSAAFPIWQIFVVRSLLAIPVLIAVLKGRSHDHPLMPMNLGWTALRSLMLVAMWVAYYTALPKIDFSVAAATYYTLPLFITLFAGLFIGEKVGLQGWIAVFLGFGGVLAIIRPQAEAFNAYALLPLASAVLYALAMILTRSKLRNENPLVLSLALNVTFIGVGLMATLYIRWWEPAVDAAADYRFLTGEWIALGAREWLAMGLLSAAIIIGSVGAAIAYQAGPSSIVSTFDFSYLAFAALWGLLFFGEVPDAITAGGITLIASAGILAVRRQP